MHVRPTYVENKRQLSGCIPQPISTSVLHVCPQVCSTNSTPVEILLMFEACKFRDREGCKFIRAAGPELPTSISFLGHLLRIFVIWMDADRVLTAPITHTRIYV